MKLKNIMLLAAVVFVSFGFTSAASAESIEDKKEMCLKLLGAGMYNGFLEDVCLFNGGVKAKILNIYNEGGCRLIISQEIVKETARDVLVDSRARYQKLGHTAFCKGNAEAYYDLIHD